MTDINAILEHIRKIESSNAQWDNMHVTKKLVKSDSNSFTLHYSVSGNNVNLQLFRKIIQTKFGSWIDYIELLSRSNITVDNEYHTLAQFEVKLFRY